MSAERAFFDTNVLVYAFERDDRRSATAEALIASGGAISVQILNEFVAIARRKLRMTWEEVAEALSAIRLLFPEPAALDVEVHDAAIHIARKHGYHIYDSLVIAAALSASCRTLYSEDMRDGHVIDGLTICNPFR